MTHTIKKLILIPLLLTLFIITPTTSLARPDGTFNYEDIEGYASQESINKGESIDFHISVDTDGTQYNIDVYRIGWYGGMGGKWVAGTTTPLTGTNYGVPSPLPLVGTVDANWPVAYTLNTNSSWESGYYVAKLRPTNGGETNQIIFIVRDDSDSADIVFLPSITTYQAYNAWGCKSIYDSNSDTNSGFAECSDDPNIHGDNRAYEISFNRPYDVREGTKYLYDGDFQMIRWLEREGYDATYISSVDLHTTPSITSGHQMLLSNYHDEYYTWEMRENVTNARDAGIDLAYFTSNNIYWQMRYAPDANGNPNRTLIGYKSESYGANMYNSVDPYLLDADPNNDKYASILWREIPHFFPGNGPIGLSENALLGGLYEGAFDDSNNYSWVVQNANHFIYTGAGVPGGASTGLANNNTISTMIGDEYDRVTWGAGNDLFSVDFDSVTPSNLTILSQSPIPYTGGSVVPPGGGTQQASIYQAPSGAYVFNGSTNRWALKLDNTEFDQTINADSTVEVMTRNLLNQMIGSAPTPPVIEAAYIFDDGLSYLWDNNQSPANFRETAQVYSGTRSISINIGSSFPDNRISLNNTTEFDPTVYNYVQLAIYTTQPGQDFSVQFSNGLYNDSGAQIDISQYISGAPSTIPPNQWHLINVPLSAFPALPNAYLNPPGGNRIGTFWLRSKGATGLIYVDEIAFVKTANTPPQVSTPIADVNANEDTTPAALNLLTSFTDVEDASADLVYTIVGNTNPALVNPVINNTADELTLNLLADANGTADLTIQATDSGGLAVTDTFTLTVAPVNDKPTIGTTTNQQHISGTNTAQTIPLASWTSGVTFGPADENTQAVQQYNVSVTSATPAGFFTVAPVIDTSGNLIYTPSGAEGNATLSITVQDNGGTANGGADTSDAVTLTVEIVGNFDPTTTGIGNVTVNEDAADSVINLTTSFDDAEDGAAGLTYSVTTNTNSALVSTSVDNTANTLTLSYAANGNGTADVTVQALDSGGKTVTSTFTVTVNAVNDKPSFTAGGNQIHPNGTNTAQTVNGWASAFVFGPANESGQAVNAFIVSNDNNALFSTQPTIDTSGNLTYTPTGTLTGIATVSVQLRDDGGTANSGVDTSDTATFTIAISDNLPPTVDTVLPDQTVNEDDPDTVINLITPTQYFSDVEDTDPATLTYTIQANTNPTLVDATTDNTADTLTLDYLADQNGTADITVRVTDSGGLYVDDTFTVTVAAVNDPPTASLVPPQTADEDGAAVVLDLTSIFTDDTDNPADLTYTLQSNSNPTLFTSATVDNTADTLTLTLTPDDSGTADIVLRATDSEGLSTDTAPFTVTVNEINDAPIMAVTGSINHPAATSGAQSAAGFASVTSFGATDEDVWQTIAGYNVYVISGAGIFTTPPTIDTSGNLTYDLNGTSGTALMKVEVTDSGDSTPPPNDDTSDFVTFTISVSSGANTAPTTSGLADVNELEDASDTVIDLAAAFSDAEDASADLIYTVENNTNAALFDSLAVDATTDELTLDYKADANGTSVITIQATDSGGLSVTANFTVTVAAVNDKPAFANLGDRTVPLSTTTPQTVVSWAYNIDMGPTDEDSSQTVLAFNVSAPTGDAIFTTPPAISNGGDLTFTPNGSAGTASVTVTLTDSGGTANGGVNTSDVVTLTIAATNTNTTPATSGITDVTATESDPPLTLDLTTAFNDAEDASAALVYTVLSNTDPTIAASSVSNITDLLTLTFTPGNTGSTTLTVRAQDSGGLSVTTSFTVTVNSAAPPPPPATGDDDDGDSGDTGSNTTYTGDEGDDFTVLDVTGRTVYYNGDDGTIVVFIGTDSVGQVISGGRLVVNDDGTYNVFNSLGDAVIDRAFVLTALAGRPDQLPDIRQLLVNGALETGVLVNADGLPLLDIAPLFGPLPEAQFSRFRMHTTNPNRTFTRINEPLLITMVVKNPLLNTLENVQIDIVFEEGWRVDDPSVTAGVVLRRIGFGQVPRRTRYTLSQQANALPEPTILRHQIPSLGPEESVTLSVGARVVPLYPRNVATISSVMRVNGQIVEREDRTVAIIASLPNTGERTRGPLWAYSGALAGIVLALITLRWWRIKHS